MFKAYSIKSRNSYSDKIKRHKIYNLVKFYQNLRQKLEFLNLCNKKRKYHKNLKHFAVLMRQKF